MHIIYLALSSRANSDHIAHMGEMVGNRLSTILTSNLCFLNSVIELTKFRITQYFSEVAGRPELDTLLANSPDAFEW